MHGIALLAHAAPYAYINNITDINIAATYSVKDSRQDPCASYPTIDAMLQYCGCKIYHDGFEKSRTDKVRQIVDYSDRKNKEFKLRVCWEQITGENCCVCEKCQRTIFGIYAVGGDPERFAFDLTEDRKKAIINNIRTKEYYKSVYWDELREILYANREKLAGNRLVEELLKGYSAIDQQTNFYPTVYENNNS